MECLHRNFKFANTVLRWYDDILVLIAMWDSKTEEDEESLKDSIIQSLRLSFSPFHLKQECADCYVGLDLQFIASRVILKCHNPNADFIYEVDTQKFIPRFQHISTGRPVTQQLGTYMGHIIRAIDCANSEVGLLESLVLLKWEMNHLGFSSLHFKLLLEKTLAWNCFLPISLDTFAFCVT